MTTVEKIYEIWRPMGPPWTRWVKPVLFSFLREEDLKTENYSVPSWHVPLADDSAIIADLPGPDGVVIGIALSHDGYRPIPVYNASPFAVWAPHSSAVLVITTNPQQVATPVVVDLLPIMTALCGTAGELGGANLPPAAPPAFLLDSNRWGWTSMPDVGWFDNRSFITATDFPSASFFKEHGVCRIILVQKTAKIEADLVQVLLALQREGMSIAQQAPWEPWDPRPITVKRLPLAIDAWHRLRRVFGYRRNSSGFFGEVVPPSSG